MITAICSDIDGTLLNSKRELSDHTISVIRSVNTKVPIILASSRMPSAMTHLQAELQITDHPLICYNGGYVLKKDKSGAFNVIDSVQIPLPVCQTILSLAAEFDVHVSLFSEDDWYARQMDQWTLKEQRVTKVTPQILPFNDVLATWTTERHGAHKIMCMGDEKDIADLYNALYENVSSHIHIYRSKSTYLELAPRAISKASALELVMKQCYGRDLKDVMAFGDNYNDVDMLRSVGYGIAVSNANDAVKAVAREITESGKDDGVAIAIEKYRHLI